MILAKTVIFLLKNWKIIVPSLAALSVGFGAAWFIQGVRVEYAKSEILNLKSQIVRCQDANAAHQETIGKLKTEIQSAHSLCGSRLGVKDKVINRLREIDSLKGINPKPIEAYMAPDAVALTDFGRSGSKNKEVKDEKGIDAAVDDPLLNELNGMFIDKADSKD